LKPGRYRIIGRYDATISWFNNRWWVVVYHDNIKIGEIDRLDPPRDKKQLLELSWAIIKHDDPEARKGEEVGTDCETCPTK